MTDLTGPSDPDQEPTRMSAVQSPDLEPAEVSEPEAPEEAAAPTPTPTPKVKRKRAISTPALYSLLAVLGLIVGTGAGYAVQYDRKPTPLPALAVAQPVYPPSAPYVGEQPSPLPAGQDDAGIADGNLAALLVPTPDGATATPGSDHIWLTLADLASSCVNQSACLSNELSEGVSRAARTAWSVGTDELVQITITEYSPGFSDKAAADFTQDRSGGDDTDALPAPTGSGAQGYSYLDSDDTGTTDYMVALHGNLLIEFMVWTTSAPAPGPSYIDGLVTQQLARL